MEKGIIHITNTVMFWYFRSLIGFKNVIDPYRWDIPDVLDMRVLYPYQVECVDKLIECKTSGSILWIDVGMGKTLIVLSYLKYLMDNGIMSSYCCYTLPPSALDSIVKEIGLLGIPYNILDMRQNSRNQTLRHGCINLLFHDHLRLGNIADQLRSVSDNLTFIIDEFHQCLSSTTIRTSLTLEIAKLSNRFIAMSGTILNSIDAVDDMVE
jgi:SNF2 family DNA or RNA helicase